MERFRSRWLRLVAVGSALALSASMAAATPPPLPDIVFPINTASIATKIGVAGAAILLLVFGVAIGFSFVKKLMKRVKSAV